ncbi:basic secretory family protein [Deinococcus aestuarii]|uniref:basic secretory family protein n=1 Tax=Deinococcus aestuarii TaxID=2774531 RepID=UPI001C0BBE06|nr:basic secretory family protein [Deinococcus aestuarii]
MTFRAALLVGLTLLGPAALAQRTPQELAQALQQAARAGDAAAYRNLLAPSGTFTVEGANFAADLARRTPADVTYTFSELGQEGSRADVSLTLTWTRVPEGRGPSEGQASRVTLPVQLVRVGEVWRYAGEAFIPVKTETGSLLALRVPGLPERVSPLAPLLPRAAQEVKNVLGLPVPPDAVVKVYPDSPSLSASVYLSLPPVAGWNEPGEAIKLVMPGGTAAEVEGATLRVLTHEFTHLAVGLAAGPGRDKRIPWWLHEGLANFAARTFVTERGWQAWQSRVNGYARSGWVPLGELADFPNVPEARWDNAYRQGLGVVEYLAATRGKEGPWQLARAFAQTGESDAAARGAGFSSFAALETAARTWLAAR